MNTTLKRVVEQIALTGFILPVQMIYFFVFLQVFPTALGEFASRPYEVFLMSIMWPVAGAVIAPLIGGHSWPEKSLRHPKRFPVRAVVIYAVGILFTLMGMVFSSVEIVQRITGDVKTPMTTTLVCLGLGFFLPVGINVVASLNMTQMAVKSKFFEKDVIFWIVFYNMGTFIGMSVDLYPQIGIMVYWVVALVLLILFSLTNLFMQRDPNYQRAAPQYNRCISTRFEIAVIFLTLFGITSGAIIGIQYYAYAFFNYALSSESEAETVTAITLMLQQGVCFIMSMVFSLFLVRQPVDENQPLNGMEKFKPMWAFGVLSTFSMLIFWWPGVLNYYYLGAAAIVATGCCSAVLNSISYIYLIRCFSGTPQYFGIALGLLNTSRVLVDCLWQMMAFTLAILHNFFPNFSAAEVTTFGLALGTVFAVAALFFIGALPGNIDFTNHRTRPSASCILEN